MEVMFTRKLNYLCCIFKFSKADRAVFSFISLNILFYLVFNFTIRAFQQKIIYVNFCHIFNRFISLNNIKLQHILNVEIWRLLSILSSKFSYKPFIFIFTRLINNIWVFFCSFVSSLPRKINFS